jgi:hypothetical protein
MTPEPSSRPNTAPPLMVSSVSEPFTVLVPSWVVSTFSQRRSILSSYARHGCLEAGERSGVEGGTTAPSVEMAPLGSLVVGLAFSSPVVLKGAERIRLPLRC